MKHCIKGTCRGSCRCDLTHLKIIGGTDNKVKIPCGRYGNCDIDPEEIQAGRLIIKCRCCDHEIAVLTTFEFTKCDCFLIISAVDSANLPKGEFDFLLYWDFILAGTSDLKTVLGASGIIQVI